MKKVLAVVCCCLLMASAVLADVQLGEKVTLDGDMRYRGEAEGKDFDTDTGMNGYSLMRTMIGFKVNISEKMMFRVKVKDSRKIGTSGSNKTSSSLAEMQEAYMLVKGIHNMPINMQLGRFEMIYGRKRIMGSGGWSNNGYRTYDGVRFSLKRDCMQFDMFMAQINERGFSDVPNKKLDRTLYGIAGKMFEGKIQPLITIDSDPGEGVENSNMIITPAVYFVYKMSGIKLEGDIAFQAGKYMDKDLSAYMMAFDVSYTLNHAMKPKCGIGVDITSGNASDIADDEDNIFKSPFQSNHAYRGYMDFFKNGGSTLDAGLMDIIVRLGISPMKKVSISLDFHNFNSMEDMETAGKTYTAFGNEIDIRVKAKLMKGLSLDAAACTFMASDEWKPDSDNAMFYYIALTSKF